MREETPVGDMGRRVRLIRIFWYFTTIFVFLAPCMALAGSKNLGPHSGPATTSATPELSFHEFSRSKSLPAAAAAAEQDGMRRLPPPPPWVENASCYSPILTKSNNVSEAAHVSINDNSSSSSIRPWESAWGWMSVCGNILKAAVMLTVAGATVVLNMGLCVVLSQRESRRWIQNQPRCILVSLAANNIASGLIALLFAIYPAAYECWPFGKRLCQLQAMARGTLAHNSSFTLMLLAVERYLASTRPLEYHRQMNMRTCVAALFLTWLTSGSYHWFMVLGSPNQGFHFNANGLMMCEPYSTSSGLLIASSYLFYFPTTMVLMYCYGTVFHSSKVKAKYRIAMLSTISGAAEALKQKAKKKVLEQNRVCQKTSEFTAAISVVFIIVVTPWTIKNVITFSTGYNVSPITEFSVSLLAFAHGAAVPIAYWIMNKSFRRALLKFLITKVQKRPLPLTWKLRTGKDEEDLSSDDEGCDESPDDRRRAPSSSPAIFRHEDLTDPRNGTLQGLLLASAADLNACSKKNLDAVDKSTSLVRFLEIPVASAADASWAGLTSGDARGASAAVLSRQQMMVLKENACREQHWGQILEKATGQGFGSTAATAEDPVQGDKSSDRCSSTGLPGEDDGGHSGGSSSLGNSSGSRDRNNRRSGASKDKGSRDGVGGPPGGGPLQDGVVGVLLEGTLGLDVQGHLQGSHEVEPDPDPLDQPDLPRPHRSGPGSSASYLIQCSPTRSSAWITPNRDRVVPRMWSRPPGLLLPSSGFASGRNPAHRGMIAAGRGPRSAGSGPLEWFHRPTSPEETLPKVVLMRSTPNLSPRIY